MNDDRGREARSRDESEYQPQWPQRPGRPQPDAAGPRLEPPAERNGSQSAPPYSPPRAQAQPGSGQVNSNGPTYRAAQAPAPVAKGDPTKETRVLPIVEPSRFERGGSQAAPKAAVPAKVAQPASRPAPQPQPQPQPRPEPVIPPELQAKPQARKPGGWQYERDEQGGDDYTAYAPSQAASPALVARNRSIPGGDRYISVNIEGTRRKPRFGWLLWLLTGVLAIVLIGGTAFALAWQGQYAGKIYQGVSIMGIDVGGKTPDAAKKLLSERVESFVSQPVTLTWRGKEWRPRSEQLGIKIDIDSTVDGAFKVGRSGDIVGNTGQQWVAAEEGYGVPLTVQFDETAAQTYLQGLASSEIDQKLFEGDIRLNGDQIDARPGEEGRSIRVYDAVQAIEAQVEKLQPGTVDLPVDVVQPSVSAQEISYIQGLLQVRISGPITATAPTKTEALDRDAIIRFTTIQRNPDRQASQHIELGWNDTQLKILADRWSDEAKRSAQNARFAWNNGSVAVLSESAEGFEPDSAALLARIKEAAGTGDKRQFDMPGKVLTPAVSSKDIGALGIKEEMGKGVSTFKGSSPERATNIKVAANLLNGAVVPPGGTFSFLEAMGGIDESHGFVEGYVIAAERTQKGVGGGVCQVSTTAFRAAFWSGVNITERNQHSYRVGWYEANGEPVGFDAAVFDPGVDLKFVNDSPGYILIGADVTPDTLTVTFYGTKLPGEVKLEGPAITNKQSPPPDVYEVDTRLPAGTKKQVETAHAGLNTLITRRIVVPGQPDKVDQFSSAYKPWPNWYIVASPSQVPGGSQAAPNPTPNP